VPAVVGVPDAGSGSSGTVVEPVTGWSSGSSAELLPG
jgi:hypothetical protein